MTTYVEQGGDSGSVVAMVLLIMSVLLVVGFGIWYFSAYNTTPSTTIIQERQYLPPPQINIPQVPSTPGPSGEKTPEPQPSGTGTGGFPR